MPQCRCPTHWLAASSPTEGTRPQPPSRTPHPPHNSPPYAIHRRGPQPQHIRLPLDRAPVPRANIVSPSRIVCTGRTASASPSCEIDASLFASSLLSVALVATTPMVVLLPNGTGASPVVPRQERLHRVDHASAVVPRSLLQERPSTGIVHASNRVDGHYRAHHHAARRDRRSPCRRRPSRRGPLPSVFATVAPVPAPALPSSTTPSEAAAHAAYPSSAPG